jgi:dihydrolipoamide dehydrogenase
METYIRERGWLVPIGVFAMIDRLAHRFVTTEAKDLVIIGGGVAGYVAAIKAGQEGMKVLLNCNPLGS